MKDVAWRIGMVGLGAVSYGIGAVVLGYPWQLALLTAFAVVALMYSARRTFHEQRRLYRTWWTDLSVDATEGAEAVDSSPEEKA